MKTNPKGGAYGFLLGLVMLFIAGIMAVVLNVVFEGTSTSVGLFSVAENQLNISATSQGYGTFKNVWELIIPILVIISLVTMYVSAQYKEHQEYATY